MTKGVVATEAVNVKYSRKQKKQIKKDRRRLLRVVEYFDFSAIIPHSPVQVLEGYVVSDIESNEIFAVFTFQNLSRKTISSLDIRLFLYRDANVPYTKIPFNYSYRNITFGQRAKAGESKKHFSEKLIGGKNKSEIIDIFESFGKASYIRIPESYFKKIELEITGVTYGDGTAEKLNIVVQNRSRRFSELNDEKKYAFSSVNIYRQAEQYHPTRVIPQQTETAWLCCCGYKNLVSDEKCRICQRDRDWQMEHITDDKLEKTVMELKRESDVMLRNKSKFKSYKKAETDEEIQKKIEDYEKVIQKLAEQERRNERRKAMIIPKIVLFFGVLYLLIFLLANRI